MTIPESPGVGWRDFLKNNFGTLHVVVDCSETPNPTFYFDLLLFHLAQGLTRPQKIPKKTKKQQNQPNFFCIFKVLHETKCVPYFI